MESLALLAAAIIAIAVIGGPLSLIFSWLRTKNRRKHLQIHRTAQRIYAVLIILFGLPALVVGIRLMTLDIASTLQWAEKYLVSLAFSRAR